MRITFCSMYFNVSSVMQENDLKIKFRNPKHHIRVAYRTVEVESCRTSNPIPWLQGKLLYSQRHRFKKVITFSHYRSATLSCPTDKYDPLFHSGTDTDCVMEINIQKWTWYKATKHVIYQNTVLFKVQKRYRSWWRLS